MPVTEDEMYLLFDTCFGFAKEMLQKRGGFLPFGAQLKPGEGISMVACDVGEEQGGREMFEFLLSALSAAAKSGQVLAVALAADVNIPADLKLGFPDGVRVLVESADASRYVYVPYKLEKRGLVAKLLQGSNKVTFAPPFGVDASHEIFGGA